jgi:diguanylate cyclase (GGDEF)-like protein/PAS domain S-box-containing protein
MPPDVTPNDISFPFTSPAPAWEGSTVEQYFRAIVQHATDLVTINDRYGIVRYMSPSVTRILGYTPEELIGRNSFELLHPADLERIVQRHSDRLEGVGSSHPVIMRLRHRNGEWRYLEARSTNMLAHPVIAGIVVNARDVTERVAQERQLRFQADLLAQINDAVVVLDAEHRVRYWNDAAVRLFGVASEDARGRHLGSIYSYRIVPPESDATVAKAIQEQGCWRGEAEMYLAHGQMVIGELSVRALRDDEGVFSGYLGVIRDKTARRQVEDRLRLMEAVVVHASDAVVVTEAAQLDVPGPRICYVNEAFCKLTGYPAAEIIGQSPRILQGRDTSAEAREQIRQALAERRSVQVELINYSRAGRPYWIDLSIAPVPNPQGEVQYFIAIQRDISARKAAEQIERDRAAILELISADRPLPEIFARLGTMVAAQSYGSSCVVVLRGLPHSFLSAELYTAFLALRASFGLDEAPFVCDDLRRDPRCAPWRELFRAHKVVACAMFSIVNGDDAQRADLFWWSGERTHIDQHLHSVFDTALRKASLALERRRFGDLLRYQAYHDQLTGLPNRYDFYQTLGRMLETVGDGTAKLALMFIDLDNFKHFNDTLGHPSGDELLKLSAQRLNACGEEMYLARWGGDEFLCVWPQASTKEQVVLQAHRIVAALAAPLYLEGREIALQASIGVSFFPEHGADPFTLLKHADTALYQAKASGRNRVCCFSPTMLDHAQRFVALEPALRRAIGTNELLTYYQPQIDLARGRVVGVEALVRWHHPEHGLLLPGAFLSIAEASGLIDSIGVQTLESACRDAAAWLRQGYAQLRISVNVAATQFTDAAFPEQVAAALQRYGVPPELLMLEVTEHVVMNDVERVITVLAQLRQMGVRIALDDFGTGYSSLSYLGRLPIDVLKIDRSFVRDLDSDLETASWPTALLEAIVTLAHRRELTLVAEGVETAAQLAAVRRLSCDAVQGFFFARAVPAEELWDVIAHIEERIANV